MDSRASEAYLEAQILTSSPQRLRLMLIDAALGAARKTLSHWEQGDQQQAADCLMRCRNIVSELIAGIRADGSELSKRVTGIYLFLFKALTEAQLRRDAERLGEAVKVLEIERETWRQVCEQMPDVPSEAAGGSPTEITSVEAEQILPDSPAGNGSDAPPAQGFVFDA